MKFTSTKTMFAVFFFFLFLLPFSSISAQTDTIGAGNSLTLLYEEDFSNPGIPQGWVNADASSNSVLWTWCQSSEAQVGNGCPKKWQSLENQQVPFAATTANSGFLTLNSDLFGMSSDSHQSQLTMPSMNFIGEDVVWINFQTHIGAYNTNPDVNAILRVSNDNGNSWTNFTCFPNFQLEDGYRWSVNPEQIFIDISSVASNQINVLIQWQWIGNFEYNWNIDDIKIYNNDPRPAYDLKVSREWFAIAPNKIIPTSQVSPIGFMADIINQGVEDQQDVTLKIKIYDGEEALVYSDSILLETVAAGELVENNLFPSNGFTPSDNITNYKAVYEVTSVEEDFTPQDNQLAFTFITSDTTFSNEIQLDINPYSVAPQGVQTWAWGNYFYVPNGDGFVASSASFMVYRPSTLAGKLAFVNLYKWEDLNENSMVEAEEREKVGTHHYQFQSNDPSKTFINVPLYKSDSDSSAVFLEDNTAYLLMLEYYASSTTDLFVIHCERRHNYEPMIWRSIEVNQPRYGSMIAVDSNLAAATYDPVGFGENYIPAIRLHVRDEIFLSTSNQLAADHLIELSPNPADKMLQVDLHFTNPIPTVGIKVYDAQGKLWFNEEHQQVQQKQFIYVTNHLANGVYFLQVLTNEGMRTQRFIVQH